MQGVKVAMPPCHRWARDLVNTGEIGGGKRNSTSSAVIYKEAVCMLGGRCIWPGCPIDDHDMLTIAHRNGDGGAHREQYATSYRVAISGLPQAHSTSGYYGSILKDIQEGRGDRYALLCANHHKKLDAVARREKRLAAKRGALR